MTKARKLSIIDIISNKKDLLWNKDYFGLFQKSKLVNHLIYGKHQGIKKILEIYSTDICNQDLIDAFVKYFAKKTKYFIRDLNEAKHVKEIEVMRDAGFLRFNRIFTFHFDAANQEVSPTKVHSVYCRGIKRDDFQKLAEYDRNCQILEYRDYLFRDINFFKNKIDDVFVFTQTQNLNNIIAYAIKKEKQDKSVFEIVINPLQAELIFDCIRAFAEKYVYFEKFDDDFYFVINQNIEGQIEQLKELYSLVSTNQLLIKEGNPKIKSKQNTPLRAVLFQNST